MTASGFLQVGLYLAALLLLVKPIGAWMARVFDGDLPRPLRFLRPVERGIYRFARVRPAEEMNWREYLLAVLACGLTGTLAVYLLQRVQSILPANPQRLGPVPAWLSFNTAVSFVTNTNWQAYSGETTMSHLTQMVGLTVQNFISAATGLAVLVAFIRGLARQGAGTIGNFWVDLVRGTLYILLPLSLILALALVSQGVVQSFAPNPVVTPLEVIPGTTASQTIALGPAASQIAIKQLGTNGGGFFNVNSAHPLENPTPFSNFLEMLAILLLPAASCFMFGRMIGDARQGRAILVSMTLLFVLFLAVAIHAEHASSTALTDGYREAGVGPPAGGNMEGKETRFGLTNSALWATATAAASNGSVNAMHDSMTPLGGAAPLVLIQLGEVVFGGVGSGLYGMLVFVLLTVFVSGLMVGRTPEYLGKKIGAHEIKMVSLAILINPIFTLAGTAVAARTAEATSAILNPGAHGFSEILYAFSSAVNNNGSAFGGLNASGAFYCLMLAAGMFVGRYWVIVPTLALAGSLAMGKKTAAGEGTLPTHGATFVLVLTAIVLVVGALTFLPALTLGPFAEALR